MSAELMALLFVVGVSLLLGARILWNSVPRMFRDGDITRAGNGQTYDEYTYKSTTGNDAPL